MKSMVWILLLLIIVGWWLWPEDSKDTVPRVTHTGESAQSLRQSHERQERALSGIPPVERPQIAAPPPIVRLDPEPYEGENTESVYYELRIQFIDNWERFVGAAGLSPAQRASILAVMAHTVTEIAAMPKATEEPYISLQSIRVGETGRAATQQILTILNEQQRQAWWSTFGRRAWWDWAIFGHVFGD